jgi:hypothetical protein
LHEASDGTLVLTRRAVAPSPGRHLTARAAQRAVAIGIAPVGASAIWLAATSDHLEHPAATALYRCYLAVMPMLVGLYWCRRRPLSRFGPLLIAFGITAWVMSWQSFRTGRWRSTWACSPRGRCSS